MNNKDIQLSKSLSWLLRHGALKEGLDISPDGYIKVDSILQHRSIRGKFGRSDLERVVQTNDKKRFSLRNHPKTGLLEVKANQGHSLLVSDAELIPILDAKYNTVVHGTYLKFWPQIKQHGLSCMGRRHIHFAKNTLEDRSVISGLRKDVEIYIFIDLRKALRDGIQFYESENGVILTAGRNGFLEPRYFSKVIKVGTEREVAVAKASVDMLSRGPVGSQFPSAVITDSSPCHTMDPESMERRKAAALSLAMDVVAESDGNAGPSPRRRPRTRARGPPIRNPPAQGPAANGSPAHDSPSPAPFPPRRDALRIIVTGYPAYSQRQDLERTFSRFGQVRVDTMNGKFATLTFAEEDDAADAVRASAKVNIYGEFLAVAAYSHDRVAQMKTKVNPRSKTKDQVVSPKSVDLRGPFAVQLERVLAAVRLTQEDVAALGSLYSDLEQVLRLQWPGCQAVPFGSITTGLGVRWSDADCFVALPAPAPAPRPHLHVSRAKRLLDQYPQIFAERVAIPRANTPIVKFFHVPTGTNCDLSFKTALGARNSKLVAHLLHSEPSLLPAAVLLKYWAKVHELTGSGRLSNYALTMLFVFFAQQAPALLPPVASLQRGMPALVDGWDTGFAPAAPAAGHAGPDGHDAAAVARLLGGFFRFYAEFDFAELVVCPYLGAPVRRAQMADLGQVPEQMHRYRANVAAGAAPPLRVNTALCVQDPFEQCHNVASSVGARLAADLKAHFKFAAEACDRERPDSAKLLEALLLQKPRLDRPRSHPEYRVNLYPRLVLAIAEPDWRAVVRRQVFAVFEEVLKIKLAEAERKPSAESKRDRERYTGQVTRAIWRRKQFSRLYSVVNLDLLEKQTRITEEVLKVEREAFAIQLQVTVTFCHDPRSAVVAIKMVTGELAGFKELGIFFMSHVQHWLAALLKAHSKPTDGSTGGKGADVEKPTDGSTVAKVTDEQTPTDGSTVAKATDALKALDLSQGTDDADSEEEVLETLVVTNSKATLPAAEPH